MSRNELYVYLRPAEAIQPYIVERTAEWLVSRGLFKNKIDALRYLVFLENRDINQYRFYISEYHRMNDYQNRLWLFRRTINDVRNKTEPYGQPHMFYTKKYYNFI